MNKTAIAIAAHPDDIEFMMAGTLYLLKQKEYGIHYMTLSDGNCGSLQHDAKTTAEIRIRESRNAASILGAVYHEPICHDFEILYDTPTLRKLSAVIREVKPGIVLTHSPSDYMEDHMNTSRLAVTAAFVRCVPNFNAVGAAASNFDCVVYHALPHGLIDPLRKRIMPGIFINTTSVQQKKIEALKAHESQQSWLDSSQKMNSYIMAMEDFAREVGSMSSQFQYSEGWRRHSHYGFCAKADDPLTDLQECYLKNSEYEQCLSSTK